MAAELASEDLLVVAGEASGDLHAARMLSQLHQLWPNLRAFGLGGSELQAAGMELVANSSEISVVGITEVMRILPRAREIFQQILQEVDKRQARQAVLVDFPDFNLRLAKALKQRNVKIVYYISPQIWAWRKGRVRSIARLMDGMVVILPFEVDFYRRHGVGAIHVGHPLVDEVPVLPQVWDGEEANSQTQVISLLPGSRRSEIQANLPVMLKAGELLAQEQDCQFRLIQARTVDDETLADLLADSSLDVEVVKDGRFQAIAASHLAICASGTATLEVGLLGTPMVVVYRVSPWSYSLGRMLVRLPHIALVNLVLERRAVPELIQHAATAERISQEASAILQERDRIGTMKADLASLRQRLGRAGASRRAAESVYQLLREGST
jgi:lipid-A-disaccharide synthase